MALKRINGIAFDSNGNAAASATVNVYTAGTTTDADIFSDDAGATAKANPITADAAGRWWFYTDSATLDIRVTAGGNSYTLEDVSIENLLIHASRHQSGGADELDHGTLAGRSDNDHEQYLVIDPATETLYFENPVFQRLAEMDAMITELFEMVMGDTIAEPPG